jgi:hypothetical protein
VIVVLLVPASVCLGGALVAASIMDAPYCVVGIVTEDQKLVFGTIAVGGILGFLALLLPLAQERLRLTVPGAVTLAASVGTWMYASHEIVRMGCG